MTSDDLGKQLHDRATRGLQLSPQEQTLLEDWYAREDAGERSSLDLQAAGKTSAALQAQIDDTLAQLTTTVTRIQQVSSENESLRRENATLRRRLPHQLSSQLA